MAFLHPLERNFEFGYEHGFESFKLKPSYFPTFYLLVDCTVLTHADTSDIVAPFPTCLP